MAKIRHPSRSFNGSPAGEWVWVPDADVPYLVSTYGVEVEGRGMIDTALDIYGVPEDRRDRESIDEVQAYLDEPIAEPDAGKADPVDGPIEAGMPDINGARSDGITYATDTGHGWFALESDPDGPKFRRDKLPPGTVIR